MSLSARKHAGATERAALKKRLRERCDGRFDRVPGLEGGAFRFWWGRCCTAVGRAWHVGSMEGALGGIYSLLDVSHDLCTNLRGLFPLKSMHIVVRDKESLMPPVLSLAHPNLC